MRAVSVLAVMATALGLSSAALAAPPVVSFTWKQTPGTTFNGEPYTAVEFNGMTTHDPDRPGALCPPSGDQDECTAQFAWDVSPAERTWKDWNAWAPGLDHYGPIVGRRYRPGTYTAKLYVRDADGEVGTATQQFTVDDLRREQRDCEGGREDRVQAGATGKTAPRQGRWVVRAWAQGGRSYGAKLGCGSFAVRGRTIVGFKLDVSAVCGGRARPLAIRIPRIPIVRQRSRESGSVTYLLPGARSPASPGRTFPAGSGIRLGFVGVIGGTNPGVFRRDGKSIPWGVVSHVGVPGERCGMLRFAAHAKGTRPPKIPYIG